MDEIEVYRDRIKIFLAELTLLSRKHGLAIEGCGCCESPYIVEAKKVESSRYWTRGVDRQVVFSEENDPTLIYNEWAEEID